MTAMGPTPCAALLYDDQQIRKFNFKLGAVDHDSTANGSGRRYLTLAGR